MIAGGKYKEGVSEPEKVDRKGQEDGGRGRLAFG